jgi:prepilin-type N-terminal cleavage/methylation domain-containing protein
MKPRENGHGPRRKQGVTGATLIELLTVMVVISILAGIALPRLRGAIVKAQAADLIGDMNVIKVAVITYQSDYNAWPTESAQGQMPTGLDEYLPEGFQWETELYTLDYQNRGSVDGSAYRIGITATTEQPDLGQTVIELMGFDIWTDGGNRFTWIIET